MKLISTHRRTLAIAALAAVGALSLTACNDDAANGDTAATTAPAAPTQAAPTSAPTTPAAPATSAAPATGGTTGGSTGGATGGGAAPAAGTTAKIGQPIQFPYKYGKATGDISLTVTDITKGDPADLAPLKLGDKAKGQVPYYINYKVTNVGSTDMSFSSLTQVKGLLADGSEATEVSIIGTFAKCPHNSFPSGFTNGKSVTSCVLALAPEASQVTGAEYWGDPYTLGKGLNWK
ncbi:hypothetical protein [Streptomyces sp. NRRL WC-3742]|uniref:hypothetical protein n=1 Tax=Streptomyces sp. NRRL WC-3742 TaxID=1463934 RepID=UPI0006899CED|nr:hypothetical protein [Streptomyces sp. NRRL WC-3742]